MREGSFTADPETYMYNDPKNAHSIDNLLCCSIFIAPTCFNANVPFIACYVR
jgi:hypothetical protein